MTMNLHSELWRLYFKIVHQTLFLDIMSHGVLDNLSQLLAAAAAMTEENKSIAAFCVAIFLTILNTARQHQEQNVKLTEKDRKKISRSRKPSPARDKKGRFTKVSKKSRKS
jgi:hypothetical protein